MQMSYLSPSDWHVWLCSVGWQTPVPCHQRPRRVLWLIHVILWSSTVTMELPFSSVRLSRHQFSHLLLCIHGECRSLYQHAVENRDTSDHQSPVKQHSTGSDNTNTLTPKSNLQFCFHLDCMSLERWRKVKQSHMNKEETWEIHTEKPWLVLTESLYFFSLLFLELVLVVAPTFAAGVSETMQSCLKHE